MKIFTVGYWVSDPSGYTETKFYGCYEAQSVDEVEAVFPEGGLYNGWYIEEVVAAPLPTVPQPFPWRK